MSIGFNQDCCALAEIIQITRFSHRPHDLTGALGDARAHSNWVDHKEMPMPSDICM